jgi:hypothetical protein
VTAALSAPHPLYGAKVFIPNITPGTKLPPLADGPSCTTCQPSTRADAVAATVTGPDGRFMLYDVPAGSGIPIVVQLGGWRMQTTIDVMPCVDTALPLGKLRLPRNHTEGDIPLTALVTGNDDKMECLLRKLGVDDSEFTNPTGGGRIHLYRANGAAIDANTPDDAVLKGSATDAGTFGRYGQILLPCQGAEHLETAETLTHFTDYVNRGGHVLATHFSYAWLFHNGAFAGIGNWTPGTTDPAAPLATDVVTSSNSGADMGTWLGLVGALSRPAPPQMQIAAPHADLGALATGKAPHRCCRRRRLPRARWSSWTHRSRPLRAAASLSWIFTLLARRRKASRFLLSAMSI